MAFLPIVDRELRVAARRRTTYWMRAGFASGATVIGLFVALADWRASSREFADNLFGVLAFFSVVYCLTSGIRTTADCLSSEKREGTLGLLFLTDLNGYDVVFGKMAATSLTGFYALLAVFPVLALPLMIGGTTNGEFWRLVLTLIEMFLFSLALGILVSTLSRNARKAMAGTFIVLLLFCVALPAYSAFVRVFYPTRTALADALILPSPISLLYWSVPDHFKPGFKHMFWLSAAVCFGWTTLFLLFASHTAPHSWQDKPGGARMRRWRERWRERNYGNASQRLLFRRRLLGVNAYYWLAARVRAKPVQVWTVLAVLGVFWGWGCARLGSEWFNEGVYLPTAIILNTVLKLWVASEAGRCLGEDRKMGGLELVLSTSLGVKDVLRGQWLALRRQFLKPLVMVVGIQLVFLAASLQRESFHDRPINPVLWVSGIILLLADTTALAWVAMWVALTTKNPNRITSITVIRILVAPWIVFVAVMIVGSSVNDAFNYGLPPPGWKILVGLWFGLGLFTDAAFGYVARRQLKTRLRELALARTTREPSKFVRWFLRVSSAAGTNYPVDAAHTRDRE